MSCETVIGSIVALFDGELAADERQAVESHLESCRACAGEAEELRATRAVLARHLASIEAQLPGPRFDDLWQRLAQVSIAVAPEAGHAHRATAARPASVSRPRQRRRRWLVAGTSAGLALAAGLAVMIVAPLSRRDRTPTPGDAAQRGASTVAAVPAPETVVAKPAKAPATRVAKAAPAAAQPAKEQVARRASAQPAAAASAEDTPHDEAVAANEPDHAVAVNQIDPPRELLERPDLFLNYPIVRKLDELRHLDAVLADQGADDRRDDGGAG